MCFLQTRSNTHIIKLTKCSLQNLPKSQDPETNLIFTEFDTVARLHDDQIRIETLSCAKLPDAEHVEKTMKDLLEQKAMLGVEQYVLQMLEENHAHSALKPKNIEQINSILQKITESIPADLACYSRAGKTYLRVSHGMGDVGNLFFKSLLNNVLKDFGDAYVGMRENAVCAICRI